MRGIIIGVLTAISYATVVQTEVTVTQVQVLFRHGERTPRLHEMYPNDIHNESTYERWGLGQLTNHGKMRMYRIGEMLKTRYEKLLSTLRLPYEVYAVSTSSDRTKMSLQILLAGLFPPSKESTWNPELPWRPIPTYYVPDELDILMKSYLCPEFDAAFEKVLQLPEVEEKVAVHEGLFEFLTNTTGMTLNNAYLVYELYNLLDSQRTMNLTLPEWCTEDILRHIREVAILQYDLWSYTKNMKTLHGGMMIRRLIENMHLDKKEQSSRKVHLYSAHDSTVSAFLQAQGLIEHKVPTYGTAAILEKLEDDEGNLFVRILLWTGVTERLITLSLPGCDEICPIKKYLELTNDVIPSDEDMDCHWRRLTPQELRRVFDDRINYD